MFIARFILLAILVLSTCFSMAQSQLEDTARKNPPILVSGLDEILQTFRPIYNFSKGEVIASVGAGLGFREVVYSLMADSLTFYLQDINVSGLAM